MQEQDCVPVVKCQTELLFKAYKYIFNVFHQQCVFLISHFQLIIGVSLFLILVSMRFYIQITLDVSM